MEPVVPLEDLAEHEDIQEQHEGVGDQDLVGDNVADARDHEDNESLWDDHQLGPVQERRERPWRFAPGDDIENEEENSGEDLMKESLNIVNVETDQESQTSNVDSDGGDNIEEKLDKVHFSAVEDNIKTKPTLKVTVPVKTDTIKALSKKRKPKPKGQKKKKD